MITIAKSLTRIYSHVKKELIQVVRRPGAFLSLILGPFLIMAIFGLGYTGVRRPLDTVIVLPQNLPVQRDPAYYQELAGPALAIREVTDDPTSARERLARQQLDILLLAPGDIQEQFRAGQQATIGVEYNTIDPVMDAYARFLAERLTSEVNREILRTAVQEGEEYALQRLDDNTITRISPEVIASPTRAAPQNLSPSTPNILAFFAPAVLALVLQHMAITLTALSLVRERLSGTMELFRVSPSGSLEILLGKYIGFGLVSAAIAAAVTALMVGLFQVPLLGDPLFIVATIATLVFASLGIGLLISVVADSERQAVQLSLLLLLASVFFSGFVLPVQEFRVPVQIAASVLPVTNGIRLLQDVMLRGETFVAWQLAVMAGVGVVLLGITTLLLRRSLTKG